MTPTLLPKLAILGSPRDPLRASSSARDVFGDATNVLYIDGRSPTLAGVTARGGIGRDMRFGDVDLIHLVDARLAPLGHRLARRYAVLVTATVSAADLARGGGLDRSLRQLDGLFADADRVSQVRSMVGGVCVTPLPLCAQALPTPSDAAERSVRRALRGRDPGRFVFALP